MTNVFSQGKKEAYDRLAKQELETARYIRDLIGKNDDTKKVYKLLTDMLQVYESRVLLDMGEGKHSNGDVFTVNDFWTHVGEVRGLRWLQAKVVSMTRKADEADEEARKKEKQ